MFFIVKFSLREKDLDRGHWSSSVVLGAWCGALPVIRHGFRFYFHIWMNFGFNSPPTAQHIIVGKLTVQADLGWLGQQPCSIGNLSFWERHFVFILVSLKTSQKTCFFLSQLGALIFGRRTRILSLEEEGICLFSTVFLLYLLAYKLKNFSEDDFLHFLLSLFPSDFLLFIPLNLWLNKENILI